MTGKPVPWTVHADSDKPHRCPNCWLVSGWVPWKTMTCCNCNEPGCPGGCGQKYASRPWLPRWDEFPHKPWLCMWWRTMEKIRR